VRRDPATVAAMVADYRAGLGVDREHDDDDRRAGRPSRSPRCSRTSSPARLEDLVAGREDPARGGAAHRTVLATSSADPGSRTPSGSLCTMCPKSSARPARVVSSKRSSPSSDGVLSIDAVLTGR
jgi:hypothetical protein